MKLVSKLRLLITVICLSAIILIFVTTIQSFFEDRSDIPSKESPKNTTDCLTLRFQSVLKLEDLNATTSYRTTLSGYSSPNICSAYTKLAIIVPYRNREEHLTEFVQHMHLFLKLQFAEFQIFIIEQSDDLPFNRAALLNVGFLESLKLNRFNCYVFHDVDHLPLDIRLLYECIKEGPIHFAVSVSQFNYTLPYDSFFGGVVAITSSKFWEINGFSNCYWGWGGEDDDFGARIFIRNVTIHRPSTILGRYHMLSHNRGIANGERFEVLKNNTNRIPYDGLKSIEYTVIDILPKLQYTLIKTKLSKSNSDKYCNSTISSK